MRRPVRFALIGLLVTSAAHAADAASCSVRKNLYEAWLSSAKPAAHNAPKGGALLASIQPAPDPSLGQETGNEYRTFFNCLSDAAVPSGEDGGSWLCKGAGADRLAGIVCQVALYIKTGRTGAKELMDALPTGKKGGDMIWDVDAIAGAGGNQDRIPTIFLPKGPAYSIVDELFVLVLDDKDTAAAKYFHIAGAASGSGARYMDSQIKILLREAPAVVVKHWDVLRQYQPKVKKVLAELAAELSSADMKKLRQGVAGFCTKDNLDCPEILKVFGRPE
jgi:hypothetical protein